MVNQTEFVDHLRKRMNKSLEEGYYLESITCSYAIIENRTKRLVEHLGKSAKKMTLAKKTQYLYTQILNRSVESGSDNSKLIGFMEHRLKEKGVLEVDSMFPDIKSLNSQNIKMDHQKLINFSRQRNDVAHDLAKYDSQNPCLINFEDYIKLAFLGKEVAEELSSIASAVKRKKKKLPD
ncbi:MAG: hypothetical protein ABF920_05050 [Lacticaseibacillus paracasei]|uniref:hypothetical protein n=1 Tax=Lacticaseibacillus paracasei TaxID=1597 RepID=UPI00345DA921